MVILLASLLFDPNLKNSTILWFLCPQITSYEPASQTVRRKVLRNLCDPEGCVGACHWGSKNKNVEHAWAVGEFISMKIS